MEGIRNEQGDNFGMVLGIIDHLNNPCSDPRNPQQNLLEYWLKIARENLTILESEGDEYNAAILRQAINEKQK